VNDLVVAEGGQAISTDSPNNKSMSIKTGDILVKVEKGVCTITLNRPEKKNAFKIDVS